MVPLIAVLVEAPAFPEPGFHFFKAARIVRKT